MSPTNSDDGPSWSYYYNWPEDLNELTEPKPTEYGRLDTGGFVLADSFDTILHNLSEEYLQKAWRRVAAALQRYQLSPSDLSWGLLDPGRANIPNKLHDHLPAPSQWIGWISKDLRDLYLDNRWHAIDADLRNGSPSLRCGVCYRSTKWIFPLEDYSRALHLIEALCTQEPSDWAPSVVLNLRPTEHVSIEKRDPSEPWVKVALALKHNSQEELDLALAEAKAVYPPISYRIVVRGYATFLYGEPSVNLQLPMDVLENQDT